MTVIHLVPALEEGGVERVVLSLNRLLVQAGLRSVVLSRGGKLVPQIERDGGHHIAFDLKSKNPLSFLPRVLKLRKILRAVRAESRGEPCVVCAHSRVPAWLFLAANRSLGFKWITYAHGANSVSRYSAVMTKGDLVVTPSRFLADFLCANYGGDVAKRVRVISPTVDFDRFSEAALDATVRERLRCAWGLEAGDRVVMAIGRLTPLKGFDHLIRDLAGSLDVEPDPAWGDVLHGKGTKLVIVGGADKRHQAYESELKELAASLGVQNRVVFAGAQTDIPECLSLADEVVSGNVTKPESFGLSVLEASAMNRPVRALRRFGGVDEILTSLDAFRATHPAATLRTAAQTLFSPAALLQKTLAVLRETARL